MFGKNIDRPKRPFNGSVWTDMGELAFHDGAKVIILGKYPSWPPLMPVEFFREAVEKPDFHKSLI